jgi:hypothetical protein
VSDIFADRICKLCSEDLRVFASLREDLILKQRTLYELAGLDESHYLTKNPTQEMQIEYEEANIMQDDENSQEFEIGFETVEDGQIYEEEQMEEGDFISEETTEEDETANAVIKIEKVHGGEETLGSDFDFFEEIVGEEEEGGEESLLVESGDAKDEM